MTAKELYILLSDKCNFACSHCINSSGPKASRWLIEENEVIEIAKSINEDKNFERIHFSGGEPSLFLEKIKQLQSRITRPVCYTMTTNGSFYSDPSKVVDHVNIDEFILSFDRFRAPFIKQENLVNLGIWLRERNYKVLINLVISQAEDLSLAKVFSDAGLKTLINGVIQSGRYNPNNDDYRDSESVNRTCPSISSTVSLRGYEKVIYIPESGYTPCCGPLVFDDLTPKKFSFSAHLQEYSKNELRSALREKSFSEQAKELGFNINKKKFSSACTACAFIYGKIGVLPSLYEMSQGLPKYKLYETDKYLDGEVEEIIQQKYHLAYVGTASLESLQKEIPLKSSDEELIEIEDIDEMNLDRATKFIEDNYYRTFQSYFSEQEIDASRDGAKQYYALGIVGKIYKKSGLVVGCLLINRSIKHHLISVPAVHIGYWGYDKKVLNKQEIEQIKSSWIRSLRLLAQPGDVFNVAAHSFNVAGREFLKKMGFSMVGIRLDKREF